MLQVKKIIGMTLTAQIMNQLGFPEPKPHYIVGKIVSSAGIYVDNACEKCVHMIHNCNPINNMNCKYFII